MGRWSGQEIISPPFTHSPPPPPPTPLKPCYLTSSEAWYQLASSQSVSPYNSQFFGCPPESPLFPLRFRFSNTRFKADSGLETWLRSRLPIPLQVGDLTNSQWLYSPPCSAHLILHSTFYHCYLPGLQAESPGTQTDGAAFLSSCNASFADHSWYSLCNLFLAPFYHILSLNHSPIFLFSQCY